MLAIKCSVLSLLAMPALGAPQFPLSLIRSDAEGFGLTVELSGDRLFVGAQQDDTFGMDAGAVYAYDLPGTEPALTIVPDVHLPGEFFGRTMDAVGDYLVVGSNENDQAGGNAGAAFVFDASTGQQLHQLIASDAQPTDFFGGAVATDGVHAVVGATGEDSAGSFAGAAYVYDLSTGLELHKLTGSDIDASDRFGSSVAVDGDLVVVGAESHNDMFSGQGAVYVFDVASGQQLLKLIPTDAHSFQRFGLWVGLDSQTIVVSATEDNELGSDAGAVYVFDRQSGQQLHKLTEPGGGANSTFGAGLDVQDGEAMIGALTPSSGSATAYLFDLTTGTLRFEQPAPISDFGGAYSNRFSFDGERVAMGSSVPRLVTVQLALERIGARYCSPAPLNSNGLSGRIEVLGSTSVDDDLVRLGAIGLPQFQLGYFLTSQTQGFLPNPAGSQGNLCLGGAIGRYNLQLQTVGFLGTFAIEVDLSQAPVTPSVPILAGETWNFQAWYRDANPGPTTNLTDAVSLTLR